MIFNGLKRYLTLAEMAALRLLFKTHLATQDQVGKIVAGLGNYAAIREVRYSADHPTLSPRLKARMAFGWYEGEEIFLVKKYVPADLPIIELGGSLGVLSCLTNHRLHNPRKHWVIEANPTLIPLLEKNRDLNRCQFSVKCVGLGYGGETIQFLIDQHSPLLSSVYTPVGSPATKTIQVPARTLASLAEEFGLDQFGLICDIEGAELDLIEHELDFLCAHVPWILMELHVFTPHGEAWVEEAIARLGAAGYEVQGRMNDCCCFKRPIR